MEIRMDTQFTQRAGTTYNEEIVLTQAPAESAIAWCAVFAGAVASASLSLILLFLGTGFGLSLISPWSNEGISGSTFGVSSIAGVIVISLLASAIGGYIAGRLRTRWTNTASDEVFFRDTAHGFLSWSVATLGTAALLATVTSAIISGGVKTGTAALGAGAAATAATNNTSQANSTIDEKINSLPLPYHLDALWRGDTNTSTSTASLSEPLPESPEPTTTASEDLADTEGSAATTQTTLNANNNIPRQTFPSRGQNIHARGEVTRIFVNGLATGSLPEDDLTYASQLIAQATGVDQASAEQRVRNTFSTLQTTLSDAEKAIKEAADKAREVAAHASLWLFISLLSGAFIASLMAVYGGRQRDL
jgi:hypothetical protein